MTHTFYVKNDSDNNYNFPGIFWDLDTMLDNADYVTVIADGRGGGFLKNSSLTVALTPKYGTQLTAMRWSSGATPHPLTGATQGTEFTYDDSAVHYQLKAATIAPGETQVWGFGEQMFTGGMDPTKVGIVRVRYIDENHNDIAQTKSQYVKQGTDYPTEALTIDGYHLTQAPADTTVHNVGFGTTEVDYVYKKISHSLNGTNDDVNATKDVAYGQMLTSADATGLIFDGTTPVTINAAGQITTPDSGISSVEWVVDKSAINSNSHDGLTGIDSEGRDISSEEESKVTGFNSKVDSKNVTLDSQGNGTAHAYLKVTFTGSSTKYIIPVTLNVHGGYAAEPTEANNVIDISDDGSISETEKAKVAESTALKNSDPTKWKFGIGSLIANHSDLHRASDYAPATDFKFVKDESGTPITEADLKYDAKNNEATVGTLSHLTPVSGYVQITYTANDGSTSEQYVPVTIYIASMASRYAPTKQSDAKITVHAISNGTPEDNIADFYLPTNIDKIVKISGVTNAHEKVKYLSWDTDALPDSFDLGSGARDGVQEGIHAGIIVHYADGSTYALSGVPVKIIGGYEAKTVSGSTITYPTTVANGAALTVAQAKDAIKNASDLDQFKTVYNATIDPLTHKLVRYSSSTQPLTYTWAANADGTGTPDTTYNADVRGEATTTGRQGYVVITYGDGTKQIVSVHYNVQTYADKHTSGINVGEANGNPLIAHVGEYFHSLDANGKLTITDSDPSLAGWTFANWATKGADDRLHDISAADTHTFDDSGLINGVGTVSDKFYAKIKLADGSFVYSSNALKVKVVGAVGQDVVFDKQRTNTAPNAMTTKDLNGKTAIKNVNGSNGISQFGIRSCEWKHNDSSRSGIDWREATGGGATGVPVILSVTYSDGTTQDVNLNLKINNDSESFNAHHGTVRLTDGNNPVIAHVNQDESGTHQPSAAGKLTIKQGSDNLDENTAPAGAAANGWKFVGWALKDGSGYHDVDATHQFDLTADGLNGSGQKTIRTAYAKIQLKDGSTIYSSDPIAIKVYGGCGQSYTCSAQAAGRPIPGAENGVKKPARDALNSKFPGVTYRWVRYDGSATPTVTDVTAVTDFTRPLNYDANGKSIAANDTYVEITYTDGTHQYVKAPLTIQRASDAYGDYVTANGSGITTHVNAPSADYDPKDGFTESLPATAHVTVSYAWATAPDVTASGLDAQGKRDVTVPVTITFTDRDTGLTSTLTKNVTVHVIGGVAASRHQSVQESTLPTAGQAEAAIGNSDDLTGYNASYAWYESEGGSPLTTRDTVLPSGTNRGSKQVWVKISYKKDNGTADGEQWVQTTLDLVNDLAHQYHNLLSSNTVTVVKNDTPLSGDLINGSINNAVVQDPATSLYHLTTAKVVNIDQLPGGTTCKWLAPVDISSVGNVAATVQVTYSDGSTDNVPTVVSVIDHIPKMNEIFTPAGGEISVDPNTRLDPTHNDDKAKAGITNASAMPAGTTFSWSSAPTIDTSKPGTRLVGIVNVNFSDNTSNSASVIIHVNGRSTDAHHPTVPSEASRYTPQGKDLYKSVDTAHPNDIGDAKLAIANTYNSSAADKLPSDATYSWQYVDNNILATAGTKGAIVRVSYPDDSHTDVPISVHVTASQSDAELHPASGQDITTEVNDPARKVKAENGIANASSMPAGTTYSWVGSAPDVSQAGDIPANVKVSYPDNSANTVAIFVHVTSPAGTGSTLASEHLNPTGGTIDVYKDLNGSLSIDDVLAKLNSQHSFFTNEDPSSVAGATPIGYSWANSEFGTNVLHTTGLKSGQVLIKYADNSTDTVTVLVNVKSIASKYANVTAKAINTTVGGSVTAKEGLDNTGSDFNNDVQTIDFISPANLDRAATSANPNVPTYTARAAGTYGENIKITFKDNSTKTLATSLVVSSPGQTLADVMIPTGGLITRYVGDSLGAADAEEAVSDHGDMPDNTTYSWVTTPDTSSKGLKSGEVKVHFRDESEKNITVHVDVKPMADKYTPLGQNITIAEPASDPLSGTNRVKDGISNTAQLPADTTYVWASPVDISQADTTVPGLIKVTYRDNSVDTVAVNVIVGHPENNPQTNNPVAKIINVNYGDVFDNNNANAKRGVQNTNSMPSDAVYSFVGSLPTDSSNKIDQTGDIPVLVHIVGTDYDKSVATVIHVVNASQQMDANHEAPIGKNVYTGVGDVPDAKQAIMNASDPDSLLSRVGASYSWATGGEPDVNSTGTTSGVVQVKFSDGSTKLVPVSVTVTADGQPHSILNDNYGTATSYNPVGQSLERERSSHDTLDAADARVAVGLLGNTPAPAGTTYSWVDPSFAQTALKTPGYKTSQVKITYPDGSENVVLATVHVTTMAETAQPTPLSMTYDPDIGWSDNLNDPDSLTPAIDPSTLPSGTLVRFPDGVAPTNLTPGDHAVQIEIDYPDGTKSVVPTVIHVPASSENAASGESLMPSFITPNSNGIGMPGSYGLGTPSGNGGASAATGEVPSVPAESLPSAPVNSATSGGSTVSGPTASTTVPGASVGAAAGEITNVATSANGNGTGSTTAGASGNTAVDTTNNDHDNEVPTTPGVRQQLVIYIGKSGRIVKKAQIKVGAGYQSLETLLRLAKAKDKMPKGYQATGKARKVAKHLDVWVTKKGQPGNKKAPRTKDVLYITKDGKIVKRTRITGDVNKLAKSKLPKGYKISGINRVNNHYNIWVKKSGKQRQKSKERKSIKTKSEKASGSRRAWCFFGAQVNDKTIQILMDQKKDLFF